MSINIMLENNPNSILDNLLNLKKKKKNLEPAALPQPKGSAAYFHLTQDGYHTLQPSLYWFFCQGHLGVAGDRRGKICGLLFLYSNQSDLFKK